MQSERKGKRKRMRERKEGSGEGNRWGCSGRPTDRRGPGDMYFPRVSRSVSSLRELQLALAFRQQFHLRAYLWCSDSKKE